MTTATLVQLIEGTIVSSSAEDWRLETLARHVIKVYTPDGCEAWLDGYRRKHGDAEAAALRAKLDELLKQEPPW
jgi:hypothetical protein